MSVPNTLQAGSLKGPDQTHRSALRTVVLGTAVAGTLDICAAIVTWLIRANVPPQRTLQGIAAGLLGREQAIAGGWWTAGLGLLLHFLIMSVIVAVFYAASRKLPMLAQRWLGAGIAYGVAVYVVMSFVVVPLSALPSRGIPPTSMLVIGVLTHIVCVGLPIAFVTKSTSPGSSVPLI